MRSLLCFMFALTATAAIGCECSDGTSAASPCPTTPPTCTYNLVNFVQVTTTANYKPMFPWPGIPTGTLTLQGFSRLRAGL